MREATVLRTAKCAAPSTPLKPLDQIFEMALACILRTYGLELAGLVGMTLNNATRTYQPQKLPLPPPAAHIGLNICSVR